MKRRTVLIQWHENYTTIVRWDTRARRRRRLRRAVRLARAGKLEEALRMLHGNPRAYRGSRSLPHPALAIGTVGDLPCKSQGPCVSPVARPMEN